MKIGILTLHRPCNFGANLQAYSSYRYFTSLGYDVKVIDYVRVTDANYKCKVSIEQYKAHQYFIENNLPLTAQCTSAESLANVVEQEHFDMIFIGADAIWRKPNDNYIYFAKWLFETPSISETRVCSLSAAHMGLGFQDLDAEGKNEIRRCLEKFHYITVRDTWTQYVINRDIFAGEAFVKNVNPDPVFNLSNLLPSIEWLSQGINPKEYILMSLSNNWGVGKSGILRKIWFNHFKRMVNRRGYKLIELPIPEGKSGMPFDYCVDYPIDPLQWFLWIKNARGFCGLRFHAIVSSISNGTPFFSIDSYCPNSKKRYLLDLIGLHSKANSNDQRSKIRNLLEGSPFEANRCGGSVEFVSPRYVLNRILGCKESEIIQLRDRNLSVFRTNIENALR